MAYRQWALDDREGFTLVFGPALAGFEKGHQAHAAVASRRARTRLRRCGPWTHCAACPGTPTSSGVRRPLPLTKLPPALIEAFCDAHLHGADPATELAMAHCWASLHGFVTLEVNGNLSWHGPDGPGADVPRADPPARRADRAAGAGRRLAARAPRRR